MKRTFVTAVFIGVCFMLNGFAVAEEKSTDSIVSDHMVAEAMLTAHFIDAAHRLQQYPGGGVCVPDRP